MQDAGSNGTVAAGSQCILLWHSENLHFRKWEFSLGLRNWEFSLSLGNALFLAKFHVFATHTNFAKLAKSPLPSEILHFRYLLVISLTSEIFEH